MDIVVSGFGAVVGLGRLGEMPWALAKDAKVRFSAKTARTMRQVPWPNRFLRCCQKADVRHPALNRGTVSIRWFNKAVTEAYKRGG
jgi:hypothetical protein